MCNEIQLMSQLGIEEKMRYLRCATKSYLFTIEGVSSENVAGPSCNKIQICLQMRSFQSY
jgi:hypothetical protein